MGCDIHLCVESFRNGKWISVDAWKYNDDPDERKMEIPWHFSFFHDRNYNLFGKLAGVRGSLEPLSEPKGLPIDVSSEVKAFSDIYGSDGHSHSWLTLEELYKFKWHDEKQEGGLWSHNWYACLDRLRLICTEHRVKENEVRIVFWFDN